MADLNWDQIDADPGFRALPPATRVQAKEDFFRDHILPQVGPDNSKAAYKQFMDYKPVTAGFFQTLGSGLSQTAHNLAGTAALAGATLAGASNAIGLSGQAEAGTAVSPDEYNTANKTDEGAQQPFLQAADTQFKAADAAGLPSGVRPNFLGGATAGLLSGPTMAMGPLVTTEQRLRAGDSLAHATEKAAAEVPGEALSMAIPAVAGHYVGGAVNKLLKAGEVESLGKRAADYAKVKLAQIVAGAPTALVTKPIGTAISNLPLSDDQKQSLMPTGEDVGQAAFMAAIGTGSGKPKIPEAVPAELTQLPPEAGTTTFNGKPVVAQSPPGDELSNTGLPPVKTPTAGATEAPPAPGPSPTVGQVPPARGPTADVSKAAALEAAPLTATLTLDLSPPEQVAAATQQQIHPKDVPVEPVAAIAHLGKTNPPLAKELIAQHDNDTELGAAAIAAAKDAQPSRAAGEPAREPAGGDGQRGDATPTPDDTAGETAVRGEAGGDVGRQAEPEPEGDLGPPNKDGLPTKDANVGLTAGMSKDGVTSVHDAGKPDVIQATHTDADGVKTQQPFNLRESHDKHERDEKALLDAGHTYPEAHRIATEQEHARQRQLGFDPNEIEALAKPSTDEAAHEGETQGNTTKEVTAEPLIDSGKEAMQGGPQPDPRFVIDADGGKYTDVVHRKILAGDHPGFEVMSGQHEDGGYATIDPNSGKVLTKGKTRAAADTALDALAKSKGRRGMEKFLNKLPPKSQQQLREQFQTLHPEAAVGGEQGVTNAPEEGKRQSGPEGELQGIRPGQDVRQNEGQGGEEGGGQAESGGGAEPATQEVKLPPELAGAKPRYNVGAVSYAPNFESDIDKAAYITAQKIPSKADAQYRDFLKKSGMTDAQITAHGKKVRTALKDAAKDQPEGGPLTIPRQEVGPILKRFPGEDGTEAVITKGANGFHVTLRDTDADQSVATKIVPTMERGEAEAQKMVGAKQPVGHRGNPVTITVPGKGKIDAQWAVVDAGDHSATMTAADNQARDRSRAASQVQVSAIARNPDYDLVAHAPTMTDGAPVMSHDGQVVAGNGRFAGISDAYDGDHAAEYRRRLMADAESKGLDPKAIGAMRKPVLVRMLPEGADVRDLALRSNEGGPMRMSALEQSRVDAERLGDISGLQTNDDGQINQAGNRDMAEQVLSKTPQEQHAGFVDKDGMLSAEGITRLRNAVLFKAYGDSPMLGRLVESTDPGMRNIANALVKAAPRMAQMRDAIKSGDLHDADITPEAIEAAEFLNRLREKGMTLQQWKDQGDLLGEPVSDVTSKLLDILDESRRSPKPAVALLHAYDNALKSYGSPKEGSLFGDEKAPTKGEVLEHARKIRDQESEGPGGHEAGAQPSPRASFQLESHTNQDIAAREAAAKSAADAARKRDRDDAARAAADREPLTLTGSDRPADVAAAKGQRSLFSGFPAEIAGKARQVAPPNDRARALAAATRRMFGRQVKFFTGTDPRLRGVYHGGDTLWINAESDQPHAQVIGHELVHSIAENDPQTYQRLVDAVGNILKGPEANDYKAKLAERYGQAGMEQLDEGKAHEELMADLVGHLFSDPGFVRDLQKQMEPSVFRKVLAHIQDFANRALATVRGTPKEMGKPAAQYVTDLQKLRSAATTALKEAGARRAETFPEQIDRLKQERDERRDAINDAMKDDAAKLVDARGNHAVISPDPSNPGGYRRTHFDGDVPTGHIEHASREEAINAAAADGYRPVNTPRFSRGDSLDEDDEHGNPPVAPKPKFDPVQKIKDAWDATVADIYREMSPMKKGNTFTQAAVKTLANAFRLARERHSRLDQYAIKHFDKAERELQGQALDEQSVLTQKANQAVAEKYQPEVDRLKTAAKDFGDASKAGVDARRQARTDLSALQQKIATESASAASEATKGKGLDRLDPKSRDFVERLNAFSQELWERAKAAGLVDGEGLPYWMPRMFVNFGAEGEATRVGSSGGSNVERGSDITTSSPNLKRRNHLLAADSESAAKAKFGDGTKLVTDIRAMPLAMERMERAVASRELMNKIKEFGKQAAVETVSDRPKAGFFTLPHPAFQTYGPHMILNRETGKMEPAINQNGDMDFEQKPLYIDKRFEGPLRSVMWNRPGKWEKRFMQLKSVGTGTIMISPYIHLGVEVGRALPAMPGKIATMQVMRDGKAARQDWDQVSHAIGGGMATIGKKGEYQDLTSVASEPEEPGQKAAQSLYGVVGKMVAKGVEKAGYPETAQSMRLRQEAIGEYVHNTMLWDKIANLQMGLFVNFKKAKMAEGMNEYDADRWAAHQANRFAGTIPREAMSQLSTRLANLAFFSRQFTLGNLGVFADMFQGIPSDVASQIEQHSGLLARAAAVSAGRKKAISTVLMDVGMMYALNSVLQDTANHFMDRFPDESVGGGYARRFKAMMQEVDEHPSALLNPVFIPEHLSATYDNHEEGKGERIMAGHDKDGTAIYWRTPFGKVGEEFVNWGKAIANMSPGMLVKKESILARPIQQWLSNDKGFGHKLQNEDPKDIGDVMGNVGAVVWNFMKAMTPSDSFHSAANIITGKGKGIDYAKVFAPFAGITASKGAPGGEYVGDMLKQKGEESDRIMDEMPEVHSLIEDGKIDEARAKLRGIGMNPREVARLVSNIQHHRLSRGAQRAFQRSASPEEQEDYQRDRAQHQLEEEPAEQ